MSDLYRVEVWCQGRLIFCDTVRGVGGLATIYGAYDNGVNKISVRRLASIFD